MTAKKKKEFRVSYSQWSQEMRKWVDRACYREAVSAESAARSVARDEALSAGVELMVEEIGKTVYFNTTTKTTHSVELAE